MQWIKSMGRQVGPTHTRFLTRSRTHMQLRSYHPAVCFCPWAATRHHPDTHQARMPHPPAFVCCLPVRLSLSLCLSHTPCLQTNQILKGNLNLVNTSFPVLMFEPRSYLQKLADIWAYPDYINAAAAQQDPLERMKLLVTWVVAGGLPTQGVSPLTTGLTTYYQSSAGGAQLLVLCLLCVTCRAWLRLHHYHLWVQQ